jgi:WD repeat-containing protein 48
VIDIKGKAVMNIDKQLPVNLGKWILRYLFSNLIDEEIKRDEAHRQKLMQDRSSSLQRANAPMSISIPSSTNGWNPSAEPLSAATPRPTNGHHLPPTTPGLMIGLATPSQSHPPSQSHLTSTLPSTAEEGSTLDKTNSRLSHDRTSTEREVDYFSAAPVAAPAATPGAQEVNGKTGEAEQTQSSEAPPQSPNGEKDATKEAGQTFGKKFGKMFGMKKLGKTTTNETAKPIVIEEKSEDSDSRSSKTDERLVEDNFLGGIQKIRHHYEDLLQEGVENLVSGITPSLPNDTPVLKPPLSTTILIQEDRPDSGGVADLFEGKVGSLAQQADIIEKVAPMWLAECLLRVFLSFQLGLFIPLTVNRTKSRLKIS